MLGRKRPLRVLLRQDRWPMPRKPQRSTTNAAERSDEAVLSVSTRGGWANGERVRSPGQERGGHKFKQGRTLIAEHHARISFASAGGSMAFKALLRGGMRGFELSQRIQLRIEAVQTADFVMLLLSWHLWLLALIWLVAFAELATVKQSWYAGLESSPVVLFSCGQLCGSLSRWAF